MTNRESQSTCLSSFGESNPFASYTEPGSRFTAKPIVYRTGTGDKGIKTMCPLPSTPTNPQSVDFSAPLVTVPKGDRNPLAMPQVHGWQPVGRLRPHVPALGMEIGNRASGSHGSAGEDEDMSQRNVQQVIGRLVTDEAFRRKFEESPGAALADMIVDGLELNTIELLALASIDRQVVTRFAEALDPRIQKIAVNGGHS